VRAFLLLLLSASLFGGAVSSDDVLAGIAIASESRGEPCAERIAP